jgi:4-hydroxy-tetrahydrodipicolinate reductase
VIGSGGLSDSDYMEIDVRGREQGIGVISVNFTPTAGLLCRLATEAAGHMQVWEVIDYARASKLDFPSGTARDLAERLHRVRTPSLAVPLSQTQGAREARGATVAGSQVHSLRLPKLHCFNRGCVCLKVKGYPSAITRVRVAGTLLAIRAVPGRV